MRHPELFILRHGETEWNTQNRMQGQLDSALTQKGRAQARRQGEILASQNLDGFRACCSPQGRAFHTASIALAELFGAIHTDDALREIGMGQWQGLCMDEMHAKIPTVDTQSDPMAIYEAAPGGEGFDALEHRCAAFLAGLSTPLVIVTHGITSRMLRSTVLGLGQNGLWELPGGQGNVFHLKDNVQTRLE